MKLSLTLLSLLSLATALPGSSSLVNNNNNNNNNEEPPLNPIELAGGYLGRPPLNLSYPSPPSLADKLRNLKPHKEYTYPKEDKPWPNHNLTRRDVAAARGGDPSRNPFAINHGPIKNQFPWKNGEGPWRWGRKGKRYSKRGCGKACKAKCIANKILVFWPTYMLPSPTIPSILAKKHNRERLKSSCSYVCGAFCDYSADISEAEMAAHYGARLSVQTTKKNSDLFDDSWEEPPRQAVGTNMRTLYRVVGGDGAERGKPPARVVFKDGKLDHDN
ncbi:hypothetical protein QBC41DRAFT_333868 [Cercophora samala]|uniref:Uncharacterized protein n=1 Tax=Cercophora samala TaxID=330535 RepID=A0AA39ZLC2_9PEZI|nr:hypothetical protein QBC41DRAFT_333868 [Cercophora samala]